VHIVHKQSLSFTTLYLVIFMYIYYFSDLYDYYWLERLVKYNHPFCRLQLVIGFRCMTFEGHVILGDVGTRVFHKSPIEF